MSESYQYKDGLLSPRLITRFLTKEDIPAWVKFIEHKEATQFFPHSDLSPHESACQWVHRQLSRYAEKRYGLQALIDRNTGKMIGQGGLLLQEVDGETELEVGYHILPEYWGQGYAPEAARLFIDFAFQNGLAHSVISIIDTRNNKSKRVAEKNDLKPEKQTLWSNLDVYIYRIRK